MQDHKMKDKLRETGRRQVINWQTCGTFIKYNPSFYIAVLTSASLRHMTPTAWHQSTVTLTDEEEDCRQNWTQSSYQKLYNRQQTQLSN